MSHPQGKPPSHARPPNARVVPSEWKIELPKAGSVDDRLFGGCRSIEAGYEKKGMVGEGTYGEVFKAVDRARNDFVALKKIRMDNEKEGFPITAIREIKILSSLATAENKLGDQLMRNNIITLREIVRSASHKSNNGKGSIYMVFDYMEHDMTGLLQRVNLTGRTYSVGQLKCILKQLFCGLALLNSKKILHRDLKNSNLLLNNKGELKIADFGLARYISKPGQQQTADGRQEGKMTNRVITVWYRPPELFLGSEHYGSEIDMWSAGCIMFELLTGKPLFPGKDEPSTLEEIFRIMGKPNEDNMPGCTKLQFYHTLDVNNPKYPNRSQLRSHLLARKVDPAAVDLLEKLLVLDPSKRIDAWQAVKHPWFYEDPHPCAPGELPRFDESHEMNMKKRRHEAQQAQQGRQQRQRTDGHYGGSQHGFAQQQQHPPHGGPHRGPPPPQQAQHVGVGPMGPGRAGGAPAAGGPGGLPFLMPPVQGRGGVGPPGGPPPRQLVPPGVAPMFVGVPQQGVVYPAAPMPYAGHPHPSQHQHQHGRQYGGAGGQAQGSYRGGPPPPGQGGGGAGYAGGGRPGSGAPRPSGPGTREPGWANERR